MKTHFVRSILRLTLWMLLIITVLLSLLLLLHWQTNVVSKIVQGYINNSLEGQATIEYSDIKGVLINHIRIDELKLTIEDQVYIETNYLDVRYKLWPLLNNEIIVSGLYLDSINVFIRSGTDSLESNPEASFNLDSTLLALGKVTAVDSILLALPLIELKEFEIRAGTLNMVGKDTTTIKNIDLNLNLKSSPDNFQLRLNRTKAYIPAFDVRLEDLSFELIGNSPQFTLNQFRFKTEESEILFSGDVVLRDSVEMLLSLDRFFLSLPELNKIIKQNGLEAGFIKGRAGIFGAPRYFNTQWSLSGEILNHRIDSLKLDADYEYGMIKIPDLVLESSFGRVMLSGMLDLRGTVAESEGAEGELGVERLNLTALGQEDLPSVINGSLTFDLESLNFKNPTGRGELILYDTSVDTLTLDSLRFALAAYAGEFNVLEPSFIKLSQQSRFLLNGKMDRNRLVDFSISTENADLLGLSQALDMDSLNGRFDALLRATGNIADPDISGKMWILNFLYDDIVIDSTALEMDIHQILSMREGFIKFFIDSGSVYQIPVTDVIAHAEVDSHTINFSQLGFRSDQNYLSSSMNLVIRQNSIDIVMDYFRMKYEDYILENDGNILVAIDSSQVSLEQLQFQGPDSTSLEILGFWDQKMQDINASIYLQNIALKPFEQFLGVETRIDGIIRGTVEVATPLTDLALEVDLKGHSLSYNGVQFGNVTSVFSLADKQVLINQLQLDDGKSFLDLSGDLALALDLKNIEKLGFFEQTKAELRVNWSDIDLERYAPLFKLDAPLKGKVSGYLETEGTVKQPFIRQSLQLNGFKYDDFEVDSLIMFGQYSSGYLIVDSLSGMLNETSFALKGWQKFNLQLDAIDSVFTSKPFEFILNSKGDQLGFLGLFNEQLESISGPYELQLYLGGTPEHPALSNGFFRLDGGEILLSRVEDPIRNVDLNVSITDSILTINEFKGYSKAKKDFFDRLVSLFDRGISFLKGETTEEGIVEASGEIYLNDLTRPRFDLEVDMNKLFVNYFIENTSLELTTKNFSLHGRDTLYIRGDLLVPEGRLEVDLTQMQKNMYLISPETEISTPYLDMDLDIILPGNFEISSSPLDLANNFKITIEGEIGVIMEPGSDETKISGQLNTTSGKFASLNQNFEVESGSIVFTNPEEINPDIELIAEKRINPYTIQLIIGGNLEKQSYSLNVLDKTGSEVPMSMPEKLSLLTLGADLSQVTSRSDSTLLSVGEDVATTSVLTAVERGAETFTGLDRVQINSDDKILDLQKMKLNNGLQDASISFGKYLTSDLYVEYRTSFGELGNGIPAPRLSWDAGNRLGLQYRISREWALDSFYEKTLRGSKIKIGVSWEYTF